MKEHELDAMMSGLNDVILNIERFVNENKHHMLDANLRDAMNLTASMLGACNQLKDASARLENLHSKVSEYHRDCFNAQVVRFLGTVDYSILANVIQGLVTAVVKAGADRGIDAGLLSFTVEGATDDGIRQSHAEKVAMEEWMDRFKGDEGQRLIIK